MLYISLVKKLQNGYNSIPMENQSKKNLKWGMFGLIIREGRKRPSEKFLSET
jgi:hypothetical protein